MSLSARLRDARLDRISRECSLAIDRADKAIRREHPRTEEFIRIAEAKLAEYDKALIESQRN